MYAIAEIFETTSKREMIARFCKASRENFYIQKKMPKYYAKGIESLEYSVLPTTYISKQCILKALNSFVICEEKSDIYGKCYSKIGKVICFYLLENKEAMQKEINSIDLTQTPKKLNMKGVLQHIGRAAAVVGGIVLFPVFHPAAILTYAGTKIPVEDIMKVDEEINDFIDAVQNVDFTKLYDRI